MPESACPDAYESVIVPAVAASTAAWTVGASPGTRTVTAPAPAGRCSSGTDRAEVQPPSARATPTTAEIRDPGDIQHPVTKLPTRPCRGRMRPVYRTALGKVARYGRKVRSVGICRPDGPCCCPQLIHRLLGMRDDLRPEPTQVDSHGRIGPSPPACITCSSLSSTSSS